ncbi:hypothetical protein [Rhodoplanes sp. Z2-YC6860]|uniref:hypothetical protein n=1 Tax=Rhodoplanes sp. Z2-YC6860 TaxID=674703 RepID=UPI000836490C|nr:hypothetical protein [Rhodoplanes sp. Z2-YC6860]
MAAAQLCILRSKRFVREPALDESVALFHRLSMTSVMNSPQRGIVIGCLMLGFALAALAAGYTTTHWTDAIEGARSRIGHLK